MSWFLTNCDQPSTQPILLVSHRSSDLPIRLHRVDQGLDLRAAPLSAAWTGAGADFVLDLRDGVGAFEDRLFDRGAGDAFAQADFGDFIHDGFVDFAH